MSTPNKISSEELADYFIALANSSGGLITNLKLQKLVYYVQAWHVAVFNKQIFEEDFQAWVHGPVLPSLYNRYSSFRWKPIVREDLDEESLLRLTKSFPGEVNAILNDVVDEYFGMDAYALEKSTHDEEPWQIARNGLPADAPSNAIIEKQSLYDYYSKYVTR